MQLMDDRLFDLFKTKKIKYQDMMDKCVNPNEMMQKVRESGLVGAGAGGGGGASSTSGRKKR